MALKWVDRTFKTLDKDQEVQDFVKQRDLSPGMYAYPDFPQGSEKMSADETKKAQDQYTQRYKEGPNGWIIVGPNGQDPMSAMTLLAEFGVNVATCFCAALLLAVAGPPVGFGRRWFVVLLLGPIGWLANQISHTIWYRFPWDFAKDELMCTCLDWAVAGFVIAIIVTHRRAVHDKKVK